MPFNSHVTAKVFKIFLIWVYLFSFELEVFLDADLLVTYTGGDAYILEKFSFSSWSKIFFIFAKSMVFSTFLNCKSFFNSWKMSVFSLVTSYHLYACLNFFFSSFTIISGKSFIYFYGGKSLIYFYHSYFTCSTSRFVVFFYTFLIPNVVTIHINSFTLLVPRKLLGLFFIFSVTSWQSLLLLCDTCKSVAPLSTFWTLLWTFYLELLPDFSLTFFHFLDLLTSNFFQSLIILKVCNQIL